MEPINNTNVEIVPDKVEITLGKDLKDAKPVGSIAEQPSGNSNIASTFQSPNFKSGVSGWRLSSNGVLEATGVIIAGTTTPTNTLTVAQGGTGAVTLTGILKGNGTGAFTAITPLTGTKVYYVADSSGGAVTRKLTFTNGVLTSET